MVEVGCDPVTCSLACPPNADPLNKNVPLGILLSEVICIGFCVPIREIFWNLDGKCVVWVDVNSFVHLEEKSPLFMCEAVLLLGCG